VGDIEAAMKRLGHNIKPDWLEKIEHMIDAEGLILCILYTFIAACHLQTGINVKALRSLYSATGRILQLQRRCSSQTEPAAAQVCTHGLWLAAIESYVCRFNGVFPPGNPCIYIDYTQ